MNASSESAAAPAPKPAGRLKNLLKNLALSGASLLVCVGLLELILRLAGYGNLELYQPDPVLFWRLKPGQHCYTKVDHKPVRVNSHGTRGAEFTVPKPAGTLRIVSLGDSKTFGWGLAEHETYSGLLESRLRERFPARRIEVINAGVNAWSYAQMDACFRHVALAWQPDFMVLADANLWTQFSEQADPQFIRQFMSRVRLKNFLRRFALYHYFIEVKLQNVYQRYRTKFIPVDPKNDALFREQQQKDPDAFHRQSIRQLCASALTNGVKPVVLFIPILTDLEAGRTNSILTVKREICRQFHVPLFDFTPDLQPAGKALYLDADPVHLNAAGNEIVARRVFENISSQLTP